ncbi:MAG: DUF4465 domain-containing protein [Paludibacteraceae bacterium]|nr:DUF4465 domain-containing protein [Paludibacteraceae bacterium]
MRKGFLLSGAIAAMCLLGSEMNAQSYELRVLTFEDGSEKNGFEAVNGLSGWSDLIDDPQQYGQLLYGENNGGTEDPYMWTDGGNTELHHEFIDAWGMGSYAFYGGGEAISHYWSSDYETYGEFLYQLTAYRPDAGSNDMNTAGGGHNGSDNFCVHFGYIDDTGYGVSEVPALVFADGVARVIDHIYVCPTTYTYYTVFHGNELTDVLGEDGKLWIKARGFASAEDSEPSATTEFLFFAGDGTADTRDWTKWDLSSLGAIEKLEFAMYGEGSGTDNGYGLSQAAYFAWDDMAVRFPVSTPEPEEPTSYERTGLTTGNYGTICLPYAVNAGDFTGATFFEAVGQTSDGVVLEEVSSLTAGKAYIFQATATSLNCTYSGEAVATPVSAAMNNGLQGTFDDNTEVPANMYFIYGNKLWKSTGVNMVDANRAYIDLTYVPAGVPAPVAGRRRVVMPRVGEETTALPEEVENETGATKQMINGKLYIIKGGRVYDAQGKNVQ